MPKTCVVFCSDDAGLPYAAFAAARIAELHPERSFDLVIAGFDALALPDWLTALGVRSLHVPTVTGLADAAQAGRGRLPETSYLRLWLPEILAAQDYSRFLYLDIDVFPQTAELETMFGIDLGGKPLAAVRDQKQWRKLDTPVFEFEANGLGGLPYFNSGIMLIDPQAWQAQSVTQRCLDEASKAPITYTHDQGLLNLALRGDWAELHPTWNWHISRDYHLLARWMRPAFLHFAGFEKPWTRDLPSRLHDLRVINAYAAFLAQRFPDHDPLIAPGQAKSGIIDDALGSVWQWWLMRPYVDRFATRFNAVEPQPPH